MSCVLSALIALQKQLFCNDIIAAVGLFSVVSLQSLLAYCLVDFMEW